MNISEEEYYSLSLVLSRRIAELRKKDNLLLKKMVYFLLF